MFIKKSQTATISFLAVVSCFVSSIAQAAPLNNWNANSTVTDCVGTSSYGQSSTACQSYADDLYENWNPNDGGAGDTDIKTLSIGTDNDYFYFEIDLREEWDDESRQYYLEMVPSSNTTSGYFLVYKPKEEDLGSSWKNKGNSGEVEVYTGGAGGYNSDLSGGKNLSSGDFYVRLVDGNVQMALKKSKIGSPNNILVRAYASQNSSLENSKVQWNQHNTQSDLSGFGGFDSTAGADPNTWLSSNPTPTPPTSTPPTPTPPTPPTTIYPPD